MFPGGLRHSIRRVRAADAPARFIASRALWATRACRLVTRQLAAGPRMRFWPSSISAALWYDRTFRAHDVEVLARMLRPGDRFIDVGANVGQLTLVGAQCVGPAGRVVAIEAHPNTCRMLAGNVELNGFDHVDVVHAAVGSETRAARVSELRSDDQNHLLDEGAGGRPVDMRRLDDLVGSGPVRLLKIDVEGAEPEVLAGATRTLTETDAVLIEVSPSNLARYGHTSRDVLELLEAAGFASVAEPHVAGEGDGRDVLLVKRGSTVEAEVLHAPGAGRGV